MKIMHVLPGFGVGGAETTLLRLAGLLGSDMRMTAVALQSGGPVAEQLEKLGVSTSVFGLRRAVQLPLVLARLSKLVRAERPDVVQTWMYHADLFGGLTAAVQGVPVVWNLRSTCHGTNAFTGKLAGWCARLSSRLPASIIACGLKARDHHVALGYAADRISVIPNGYDLNRFAPDAMTRNNRLRRDLGAGDENFLVLALGRNDILKNYPGLLHAFALTVPRVDRVRLAIVGRGVDQDADLAMLVERLGLCGRVRLFPETNDVRPLLASADALCNSSSAEGFPNVVCEAMAMERPCIVTDAGEAHAIVDRTGWRAPVDDVTALAESLTQAASAAPAEIAALGTAARERIRTQFELSMMGRRYAAHWRAVANGVLPPGYGAAMYAPL